MEASKRRRTRSTNSQESLNAGIDIAAPVRRVNQVQKRPTPSFPLTGQIRAPKSVSLSVSSSDSVGYPDDFVINAGLALILDVSFPC